MNRSYTDADLARRERVIARTLQGASASEVAAIEGITRRSVERIRSELGVSLRPSPEPMTECELDTAAALLDDGCSYAEVARTLGRTPRAIRRHFPGRGWPPGEGARLAMATRWANHRMAVSA